MLVALAVTLVMMAAVVNLFANISGSIRNRRAVIEAGAQLRQARQRLSLDLAGATCDAKTWQRPSENRGYIEIIEGQWSDKNPTYLLNGTDEGPDGTPNSQLQDRELDPTTSLLPSSQVINSDLGQVTNARALGDWDDILALTVRSESDPFSAQDGNDTVESNFAEVIWFATETRVNDDADTPEPYDGMRTVFRRVLLIAPWRGPWGPGNRPDNISAHWDQARNQWVANTLGDLTKRENRAARNATPNAFPHELDRDRLMNAATRLEAVILSNTLAFDVRVYDPGAPLYEPISGTIVEPGDAGWVNAMTSAANPPSGYGAYCDLGWGWDFFNGTQVYPTSPPPVGAPTPLFHQLHQAGWHPLGTSLSLDPYPCVYDTWSYHYENDGFNHDIDHPAPMSPPYPPVNFRNALDQGTNGLDDDNVNGVDDIAERETSPPYDIPLRGVKVIMRIYERDARQIREASVTHSF